jgi:parallel beta-helix repeat protein
MNSNIQLHFEPYNSRIDFVNCDIDGFEARDGSNITVSNSTVSDMHAEEGVNLFVYNVIVPAHLAAWYDSRVIIYNSYISWLMIEDRSTVAVYESTVYEISCSRLSTTVYFSNVTIGYFSVFKSNFYLHGNMTFLKYVGEWEESTVVRNFNVILTDESGQPLANAEMKLYDQQNIVWKGTSDVCGRGSFNVTYTEGNYTNMLMLKVIRNDLSGARNIEFTSSTPLFLSVRLPPVHNLNSGLNYTSIQEAIDANETLDGHTIFVEKGTYFEHIIVKKRVKLLGEDKMTIIDGQNKGTVFNVTVDDVSISGFMIVNCDLGIYLRSSNHCNITNNQISNYATETGSGIYLWMSNNNTVNNNMLTHNSNGIGIVLGSNNTIANNKILYCNYIYALQLYNSSHNVIRDNLIFGSLYGIILVNSTNNNFWTNNITGNQIGVCLAWSSDNIIVKNQIIYNQKGAWICESFLNVIYNNNFINNFEQVRDASLDYPDLNLTASINIWNDGYPSGGNYWSDYTGVDADGDGIGDTPYVIDADNQDCYPLMAPFNTFHAGVWDGITYDVDVVSNSTVSSFNFDVDSKCIYFNVTGADETVGFCRVAIPKGLLWADGDWTIFVDDQPVTNYTRFEDENYTYLYFTYTHSTHTVIIQGTNAIPEYPSTITLTMFTLTTLTATTFWKTKRKRQPS